MDSQVVVNRAGEDTSIFTPRIDYVGSSSKFECPTPAVPGTLNRKRSDEPDPTTSSHIGQVVQALCGLPYNKSNQSLTDDKSPLIRSEIPNLNGGTLNSFDNIVISKTATDLSGSAGASAETQNVFPGGRSSLRPDPCSSSLRDILEAEGKSVAEVKPAAEIKLATTERSDKRRNPLKIKIPKEISSIHGIKQLSASDTRKMQEAIELANSFSRKNIHEHSSVSTPRTPGTSSKESLPGSLDSPTGHTWFTFRKKGLREKKTFVDGLNNTLASSPSKLVSPEAQQAYNLLIAQNTHEKPASSTTPLKATSSGMPIRVKRSSWLHSSRGSFSESDRFSVPASGTPNRSNHSQELSEMRRGSMASRLSNSGRVDERPAGLQTIHDGINSCDRRCNNSAAKLKSSLANVAKFDQNDSSNSSDTKTPVNLTPGNSSPSSTTPVNLSPSASCSAFSIRPAFLQRSISMFETDSDQSRIASISSDVISSSQTLRPAGVGAVKQRDENNCSLKCAEELKTCSSSTYANHSAVSGDNSECVPPPLPPRIPLRKSTVNARPAQRRFPLPSDPVFNDKTRAMPAVSRSVSCQVNQHHQYAERTKQLRHGTSADLQIRRHHLQSSSSSSSGSVQLNTSNELDDSVFSGDESICTKNLSHSNISPRKENPVCLTNCSLMNLVNFGGSINSVKLNAKDLGLHDKGDMFWVNHVSFEIPNYSQSESNLVRDRMLIGMQGRYDTSDETSYEDLMELALEVEHNQMRRQMDGRLCEEICVMRKVLSDNVSVEDCMNALNETSWDIHHAIKLIKLKQLLSTNIADKQQCKQALMFSKWDIQQAASYLLAPPEERHTPDLVDIGLLNCRLV